MRFADLIQLALANLRRNRSRSLLTGAGVAVGVAALFTLLAYGAGLQQNARGEFEALDLYNTMRVTSRPNPLGSLGDVAYRERDRAGEAAPLVPVTDSVLRRLAALPGVRAAYPEVVFPVKVEARGREAVGNAEAIPQAFARLPGYQPEAGAFFASPADSSVLVGRGMAVRLGFSPPESIVGDTLVLVTATLDLAALQASAQALGMGLGMVPMREHRHALRVAGMLADDDQAVSGFFRILLPLGLARKMQKITFFSTIDLLLRRGSGGGYAAARVQLASADAHGAVRDSVRAMGLYADSFRDQFAQLERLFTIIDLALGIIGLIALLVATLGIANTMMMNVMERRREIGVMKAVGGDEGDLQKLFVAESAALGVLGGLAGLAAGAALMALVQGAVGFYLESKGLPGVTVFAPGAGMAAGVVAVALGVSLLAGVVPARRAARVEPIEALRSL